MKKKTTSKAAKRTQTMKRAKPTKVRKDSQLKVEIPSPSYFIVTFREGKENAVQTVKAKKLGPSTFGPYFLALTEFIFEVTSPVVHSQEESMALRFEEINIFHLSVYSIISVEERLKDPTFLSNQKLFTPSKLTLED